MQRVAFIGFSLAVIAVVGAIGAGLGHRFEVWPIRAAFMILRWSAYGGISAAVLSLICAVWILRRGPYRGLAPALAGLILGATVAAVPYGHLRTARSVPPIHDISTDLDQPPPFVEVLALRAEAPNTADHGGENIARQQREAYPDIRPALLDAAPAQAFGRALAVARDLGWKIVAAVPSEGRIEATDSTFWFGFKDDVVVRVRAANGGSLVDVRSVSRVGRSDVGTNARRIRQFLQRIKTWPGN